MLKERQLADQHARNRIVSDLDRNLLVEAGAGSGKTHEMARRMAAGIGTGIYQVEHMAAVTFTRKAAAELRGRFQLALEDQLGESAGLPDASTGVARIRSALSNLERFFAGTIHSFCAHLLRERPVEAGVSPGFTELDEIADATLRKQSWRDFLMAARIDPVVGQLREAGITPKDLDRAFETVCLYEEVEFPPGSAERPDTSAGFKSLDTFWAEMLRKLPATIAQDSSCRTQKAARGFHGQMRIANFRRDRPGTLAELLMAWDFEPKITQKWWTDDPAAKKKIAAEVTSLHSAFRTDVIQPYLTAWRQYIYRLSVSLLTTARMHAGLERRRNNTLNYGDLLQLAVRVLRENAEVRRALQGKYRWLFVDEFQDTDPVQAEIIFLLAGEPPSPPNAGSLVNAVDPVDWRSIPLRPGALFIVGDPKQSIYRFRRADIDIYSVVRDRLAIGLSDEVLSLTTNFRSGPALCKWANDVFRQQFPAEPSVYSPKFAPLDAHRMNGPRFAKDETKPSASGVCTLTVPASVENEDVPAAEADRIARYIRSEVDSKRRSFSDFLILTRKKKNLGSYAKALEALQVPVELSGAGAFGKSEEVAQLALLLRVLSDPQDGISLVGVLRGPLFGISDQDLFAFCQDGGWLSIFSGLNRNSTHESRSFPHPPDVSNAATCVTSALNSLDQMFRWTRMLPVGAALERILESTGYLMLAATTAGAVEAGNLLHAIDRVRQVVEAGHNLSAAASALEEDLQTSSEVESLPLEPGQSDVVRVMNVHKAKGLEAPVVFLADPCGSFKPRVNVRIIRDGLIARGYFSITREWGYTRKVVAEPYGWDQFKEEEQTYLTAEEHRLLYVAATRARDLLVVGRWARGGGGQAWEAFVPFLSGLPELSVPAKVSAPAAQLAGLSTAAYAKASAIRDAAHERARLPSWSVTSVTSEAHHIAKIARSAESDPDDPTNVVIADTPSYRADAGMAWGTLIHGLLEHAMRHKDATREDLRKLALWLTVEEPGLRPVIKEALDTVEHAAKGEFWSEADAAPECHQEAPFVYKRGAVAPELVTGTIDLIYTTTEGWRVVDYKTDESLSPEILLGYRAQVRAYEQAWTKVTGMATTGTVVPIRLETGPLPSPTG
jgi:ATP-dependent helicase/nuclease subunit A